MATFTRLLFLSSLLSLVHRGASTQMCAVEAEQSISGMMLQRHVYKTTVAKLGHECLFVCRQEDICQSFNFVVSKGMCELNNRTKEARPEDYIPNWDRYYFRRDRHRVPLGSIPELPAASCSEIKASEGGHAVSGQHWIDSLIPGRAILLHCDMVTEDMDECNASSLVCDVNANCQNTRGSYLCSCKTGFTGDGKTCSDVDECANSSNGCHVNAICTNTYGSYRCACKPTYSGDGKTCFKFSHRGFSESNILDGLNSTYLVQLVAYLDPVLQSSNNSRFVSCWRAKTDGWAAFTFHSNCDGKGPTVSIIKVGSYIFGGYTDQSWYSSSCQYFSSSESFLYSLYNINGYAPVKLQIKSGRHGSALYRCSHYGPTFGGGHDIHISNNAASNQVSYTYCGNTYPLPPGYSSSGSSCTFYAGSYKFTPSDIEVFYEITT